MDAAAYIVNGVFLQLFQRQATPEEITTYSASINPTGTAQQLQDSVSALQLQLNPPVAYNPATWTLSLTNVLSTQYNGVTLGNGKIALITSPLYNDMTRSIITTNFDFNSLGRYVNNVVDTFKYTKVHFFSRDPAATTVTEINQTLNMQAGIFSTSYKVTNSDTGDALSVSADVMPLRQYPYCTMQTFTLTASSALSIDVYHDIDTPDNISDPVFNADLITTSTSDPGEPRQVYIFAANGTITDGGPAKAMSSASSYIFPPTGGFVHRGYNMLRTDPTTAFNKFTVTLAADPSHTGSYKYTFSVVTATMSAFDFDYPEVETRRILINMTIKAAPTIRAEHVAAWLKMWASNIAVDVKQAVTNAGEIAKVAAVNQYIKTSLYNIYAVIRDDINVEINPLNLSSIDFTGHIFFSADLWLLPVLTLLKPKAARTLLDYRYTQLARAQKLAAASGYQGVKFAYENDNVGYNDVYWDTVSPLYAYNTGLVAFSAWSYYRVTRDISWLQRKGYEILKGCADFFVSLLVYDAGDGKYHTRGVMNMNNVAVDDDALTNYMAFEAIQFAIEATYELNFYVPAAWTTVVGAVALPVGTVPAVAGNDAQSILLADASYGQTAPVPKLTLLEPLIVMTQYYSRDFFGINANYNLLTLHQNLNLYMSEIDASTTNNPVNQLLIASVAGAAAQKDLTLIERQASSAKVGAALDNVGSNATLQPWLTFTNSLQPAAFNDISVSSLYIFTLLTGLGGLRVAGGVTDSRFYYENMGILANTGNVLPNTWDKMIITGVGPNATTLTVHNQLTYP